MYTLYCIGNSAENFGNKEGTDEVLKAQKLNYLFFKIIVEVQSCILFPMGKESFWKKQIFIWVKLPEGKTEPWILHHAKGKVL